MNKIINSILIILFFGLVACESAEDLSNKLDHQVPECKSLTLSSNGQKVIVNDSIVNLLLWGVVPQINLETVVLPTITVKAGVTIEISVEISVETLAFHLLNDCNWSTQARCTWSGPRHHVRDPKYHQRRPVDHTGRRGWGHDGGGPPTSHAPSGG